MLGSLVTIWPSAFNAFVRINTGGASRALRTAFKIGEKELRNVCIVPISSDRRCIRAASSWEPLYSNEALMR